MWVGLQSFQRYADHSSGALVCSGRSCDAALETQPLCLGIGKAQKLECTPPCLPEGQNSSSSCRGRILGRLHRHGGLRRGLCIAKKLPGLLLLGGVSLRGYLAELLDGRLSLLDDGPEQFNENFLGSHDLRKDGELCDADTGPRCGFDDLLPAPGIGGLTGSVGPHLNLLEDLLADSETDMIFEKGLGVTTRAEG